MKKIKVLKLDLDSLGEQPFLYSKYDLCNLGHAIVIDPKDKDKFLEDYLLQFRKRIEEELEEKMIYEDEIEKTPKEEQ
jgi:hypothetical protein